MTVTLRNGATSKERAFMLRCIEAYVVDFADRRDHGARRSVVCYMLGAGDGTDMVWVWWTKTGVVARWQAGWAEGGE